MRILLAYPGHSHSTIDVASGYVSALRQLGHEVSTFDYHNRIAFYDAALTYWAEQNPDFKRGSADALVLASEPIAIEAIDFVPDVVLIVCGLSLHRRAFELLHRLALPMVLLLTESPYADAVQTEVIKKGHITAVLTNDKASVLPLREATGQRVEYLPHSYDPARHYPQQVSDEYRSDVYFFGTWWPERRAMFTRLLGSQDGRRFNLGGVTPISGEVPALLSNEELARHYAGTKVAINHHRTIRGNDPAGHELHISTGDAWSLGPRAFEIAACGAFQLCDGTRPELREVFGDTVAIYRNGRDLVNQVNYFLLHEAERVAMAEAALNCVRPCSFEQRAQNIVIPLLEEVANGNSIPR